MRTAQVVDIDNFKLHENLLSGATDDNIDLSFPNIEEAKNIFEYGRCLFIQSHGAQQSCNPVDSLAAFEAHINRCTNLLSKFSLELQRFLELKGPFLTQKEDIAISVLRLH